MLAVVVARVEVRSLLMRTARRKSREMYARAFFSVLPFEKYRSNQHRGFSVSEVVRVRTLSARKPPRCAKRASFAFEIVSEWCRQAGSRCFSKNIRNPYHSYSAAVRIDFTSALTKIIFLPTVFHPKTTTEPIAHRVCTLYP